MQAGFGIDAVLEPARTIPPGTALVFETSPTSVDHIFVDGMKDIAVHGGVVRISFYQARLQAPEGDLRGVHVLALAMSKEALIGFSEVLQQAIADMRKQSLL